MPPESKKQKTDVAAGKSRSRNNNANTNNDTNNIANVHLPGPDFKETLRDPAATAAAHTPTLTELEELDHTIVNLAYNLEHLLARFQFLAGVDLDSEAATTTDKLARTLMRRHRVRLAALLVKQYWRSSSSSSSSGGSSGGSGFPVFDDIMFLRHSANIWRLPQSLGAGSLDAGSLDAVEASLVESAACAIRTWRERAGGDLRFFDSARAIEHKIGGAAAGAAAGAASSAVGAASSASGAASSASGSASSAGSAGGASGSWPPALPEIRSDDIRQQVFAHKSSLTDSYRMEKSALLRAHNERLEFLGDTYLNFLVGQMVCAEFPDDDEGELSAKKASLVCNDTLFDFSEQYGLHKELRVSSDMRRRIFARGGASAELERKPRSKAVADVFEAYVGGLSLDRGTGVVHEWLRALYAPMIDSLRGIAPNGVDKDAKNELYRKVGSKDHPIEYVVLNGSRQPFVVQCVIMGEPVATGEGPNIRTAGLRAAMAALERSDIIEKYAGIRREEPKTAKDTSK